LRAVAVVEAAAAVVVEDVREVGAGVGRARI